MAEHTPLPWRIEQGITHLEIRAPHQQERSVARVYCDLDAAFIVGACNAHADLVAALEEWQTCNDVDQAMGRITDATAEARGRVILEALAQARTPPAR